MYIAVLGRQPALGVAELEQLYGAARVRWFSDLAATIETNEFDFQRLGGSKKAGRVVAELRGDWRTASTALVKAYSDAWSDRDGKLTLGISAYGFPINARDVQKTGLILKTKLKSQGVSVRLVPNQDTYLNTAASHHNKLGLSDNKVELLVIRGASDKVIIAESIGSQNITAIAARDQARPHTDAFVGMLPPKLARMMVNFVGTTADFSPEKSNDGNGTTVLLDPFCGTGVVLQEAWLMGYDVYGTDLSEKMVDYSRANLEWLTHHYTRYGSITIDHGDAMTSRWQQPIDAVVCETYLGQPFSAPPSPTKLREVRDNCNHIIGEFLTNISRQLAPGTPLCLAIPAWRGHDGSFTHLPLTRRLAEYGVQQVPLTNITPEQLLYYRETQVVARQLLILRTVDSLAAQPKSPRSSAQPHVPKT